MLSILKQALYYVSFKRIHCHVCFHQNPVGYWVHIHGSGWRTPVLPRPHDFLPSLSVHKILATKLCSQNFGTKSFFSKLAAWHRHGMEIWHKCWGCMIPPLSFSLFTKWLDNVNLTYRRYSTSKDLSSECDLVFLWYARVLTNSWCIYICTWFSFVRWGSSYIHCCFTKRLEMPLNKLLFNPQLCP